MPALQVERNYLLWELWECFKKHMSSHKIHTFENSFSLFNYDFCTISFIQLYERCETLCQQSKILQLSLLPFIAVQQPTHKCRLFHAFYSYHLPKYSFVQMGICQSIYQILLEVFTLKGKVSSFFLINFWMRTQLKLYLCIASGVPFNNLTEYLKNSTIFVMKYFQFNVAWEEVCGVFCLILFGSCFFFFFF